MGELTQQIDGWFDPRDGSSMKSLDLILQLLRETTAPFSRDQFTPGHVTATALVINPAGDGVLLVHHRRLERWLLPGGHVEPEDASIFDAAKREAMEETAVQIDPDFPPEIEVFDVHGIPSNGKEPYHLHHDILVRFRAAALDIKVSEESREVRWVRRENLPRYNLPRNILERLRG